jgi:hypothetical protein
VFLTSAVTYVAWSIQVDGTGEATACLLQQQCAAEDCRAICIVEPAALPNYHRMLLLLPGDLFYDLPDVPSALDLLRWLDLSHNSGLAVGQEIEEALCCMPGLEGLCLTHTGAQLLRQQG